MTDIENAFCPNKDCKDYGLQNHGNISVSLSITLFVLMKH